MEYSGKTKRGNTRPSWLWGAALLAAALMAGNARADDANEADAADEVDTSEDEIDLPTQAQQTRPTEQLSKGRQLYRSRCAGCHGAVGKGNGPAARHLDPRPTDFTRGVYKIRSTPSGSSPTDLDLYQTISVGIPGTAMPGWSGLSASDRWQLVYYVRSLGKAAAKPIGKPITISEPMPATPDMIARGVAVYHMLQCITCHGENGRGDGPRSMKLRDDQGRKIYPFNFSRSAKFKAGSTPQAIYKTIHTGFDGTPMKSFHGMISARDSWALVHYLRSLRADAPAPRIVATDIRHTGLARIHAMKLTLAKLQQDTAAAGKAAAAAKRDLAALRVTMKTMKHGSTGPATGPTTPPTTTTTTQPSGDDAAAKAAAAKKAEKLRLRAAKRALARKARSLYRTRCAACHGPRGKGNGPAAAGLNPKPRNLRDAKWQRSVSSRKISRVILRGGPSIGKSALMPPNPDLRKNRPLLKALVRLVRSFRR